MEALKAYDVGSTIKCELPDSTTTTYDSDINNYLGRKISDYYCYYDLKDTDGFNITVREILIGKWYIKS